MSVYADRISGVIIILKEGAITFMKKIKAWFNDNNVLSHLKTGAISYLLMAVVLFSFVLFNFEDASANPSQYGANYGPEPAPQEEKSEEQREEERRKERDEEIKEEGRRLDAEHEAGKANGTAGDDYSSVTIGGVEVKSTVRGCYNAPSVAGVAVTSPQASVDSAVSLGAGERSYVYVMDSHCGEIAKNILQQAAASHGYPAGPILDINVGKVKATGEIDYSTPFPVNHPGVAIDIGIPSGFLLPGNEPAFICVIPGGATEIVPNFGTDSGVCQIITDHPQGVFMLTQVPAGSLDQLKADLTASRLAKIQLGT